MKVGMIALTAALLMLAVPAWAGPSDPCAGSPDTDGDTVCDAADNCLLVSNAGATGCDTDGDGYGNICDADFDNGGTVNPFDFTMIFLPDFLTVGTDSGSGTDMDCGGTVNPFDFTMLFLPQFLTAGVPGPSGMKCAGTPGCSDRAQN
jgi:hypothetical protein